MNALALEAARKADLQVRSTDRLVERLAGKYPDRITGYFRLPASPAAHAPFPESLSAETIAALRARGITQLYTHQRAAWDIATGETRCGPDTSAGSADATREPVSAGNLSGPNAAHEPASARDPSGPIARDRHIVSPGNPSGPNATHEPASARDPSDLTARGRHVVSTGNSSGPNATHEPASEHDPSGPTARGRHAVSAGNPSGPTATRDPASTCETSGPTARGRHVVVVTPTASGKSLCYHLPVIEAVRRERAKALYLFPTKALAQDQVAELLELNKAGELGVRAFTFDGDTPSDARQAVRVHGDIVVSNPDMLHQAILPHHTKWAQFFESLRYVVIDELHTYRGVFGSHIANVIRRLKRICAFYGVAPTFITCSATIGNPQEHAEALIGEPVEAVTQSGAPRGERHVLLWNPPVINPDLGIRASARSQSMRIARHALRAKLKTIVFAQSRLMVEVLTKYLKDVFDHDPRNPPRVRAYRGGYLPTERRQTERALRDGSVDAVVTTSALELGVDIGALDVAVLNGYPGSIAATWQRLGRAGRRLRPSLGVLVASSAALDQYVIRHPEFFEHAPPETARIAPDQLLILLDHIRCAAFELPFASGDRFGTVPVDEFLEVLGESGVVHREDDRWDWIADSYPAQAVSLRSVADGNFVVVDRTDGRQTIIGEVDYSAAALTLYEGAIYMVQSQPFQVERLDWPGRKAYVTRTNADYYTDAIDYTKLKVLERFDGMKLGTSSPLPPAGEADPTSMRCEQLPHAPHRSTRMEVGTGEGGASEFPREDRSTPSPLPLAGEGGARSATGEGGASDCPPGPHPNHRAPSPLPPAGEAGARSATGERGASEFPRENRSAPSPLPLAGEADPTSMRCGLLPHMPQRSTRMEAGAGEGGASDCARPNRSTPSPLPPAGEAGARSATGEGGASECLRAVSGTSTTTSSSSPNHHPHPNPSPASGRGAEATHATCHHGEVHVARHVSGYKKIRFYSHENIGYGPVNLPDHDLQTSAVWWQLSQAVLERAFASRQDALDGFLGAAYALHTVASVSVMADARDLQKAVGSGDAAWFAALDAKGRGTWRNADGQPLGPDRDPAFNPTVFLYDNFPGGIGLSEPLFRRAAALVDDAIALVAACDCAHGCPACIGPVLASAEERPSAMKATEMYEAKATDMHAAKATDMHEAKATDMHAAKASDMHTSKENEMHAPPQSVRSAKALALTTLRLFA